MTFAASCLMISIPGIDKTENLRLLEIGGGGGGCDFVISYLKVT